jgi:hypothetical protein
LAVSGAAIALLAGWAVYEHGKTPCRNGVELRFANGDLPGGEYSITVTGAGYATECSVFWKDPPADTGRPELGSIRCRGDELLVHSASGYFAGLTIRATPPVVKVRIVRNGKVIYDDAVSPNYDVDMHPPPGICINYAAPLRIDQPGVGP